VAIQVVLAEDQAMVLGALAALLELEPDIQVVARAANGRDALKAAETLKPDVLVTDIEMPGMTGLEVAAALHISRPTIRTVILTTFARPGYLRRAMDSGARGYLLKDRVASLAELTDALDRIANGGTVLDPEVVAQLIGRRHDPLMTLTPREREVLQLMAEGRTNAAIATALFIGTGAVEKNVTSIFGKLGLEDSGIDHRRVLAVLAYLQR